MTHIVVISGDAIPEGQALMISDNHLIIMHQSCIFTKNNRKYSYGTRKAIVIDPCDELVECTLTRYQTHIANAPIIGKQFVSLMDDAAISAVDYLEVSAAAVSGSTVD